MAERKLIVKKSGDLAGSIRKSQNADEQSDGPKRWIGRFLKGNLLATAAVIIVVLPDK